MEMVCQLSILFKLLLYVVLNHEVLHQSLLNLQNSFEESRMQFTSFYWLKDLHRNLFKSGLAVTAFKRALWKYGRPNNRKDKRVIFQKTIIHASLSSKEFDKFKSFWWDILAKKKRKACGPHPNVDLSNHTTLRTFNVMFLSPQT